MNANEPLDLTFPISSSQCTSGFSQLTMSVINVLGGSLESSGSPAYKSPADWLISYPLYAGLMVHFTRDKMENET